MYIQNIQALPATLLVKLEKGMQSTISNGTIFFPGLFFYVYTGPKPHQLKAPTTINEQ